MIVEQDGILSYKLRLLKLLEFILKSEVNDEKDSIDHSDSACGCSTLFC